MNDPIGGTLFGLAVVAAVVAIQFWPRRHRELDPDEPTAKQLRYAALLEIRIPPRCSRRQLSRLIDRRRRG